MHRHTCRQTDTPTAILRTPGEGIVNANKKKRTKMKRELEA